VQPGVTLGRFKVRFTKNWTWISHHLNICVKFTASGKFTYKVVETPVFHGTAITWVSQRLNDPTLKVVVFRLGCRRHRVVTKVNISQHWKGYACSFNPHISISASAPAGISVAVSGWPSCGEKTQAIYNTEYGRGYQHTQFNSGSPVGFGNYVDALTGGGLASPPPCYGVFPSAIVYANGNSDSFGEGNIHKSARVCLNRW
jgi:hypothetical protein